MVTGSKIIVLLLICLNFELNSAEDDLIIVLEEKFQYKLSEYTNYVARWLEQFNDRHLGNSEIGRMLRYDVLKPKFGSTTARGSKSMNKMSLALIPLIFHVGATSTWMLVTSIMAAKSVAIGLALLVFKIAVSSAKVASFFTLLKAKHGVGHHDYSWTPHYEHHGEDRSFTNIATPYHADWSSYKPESHIVSHQEYKTIPTFKHHDDHYEELEYNEETKKGPILHR